MRGNSGFTILPKDVLTDGLYCKSTAGGSVHQPSNRTTLPTTWATASPTAISNGCLSFRQCYMCHVWKGLKKTALPRVNEPSGKSNQRENGSANGSIPQQNMWAEQLSYIRRVPHYSLSRQPNIFERYLQLWVLESVDKTLSVYKKYTPELLYNESKILCSLGVWGFLFGVPYRYCSISPNTCIRLTDSKLTGGVRREKKVYEYMWKNVVWSGKHFKQSEKKVIRPVQHLTSQS